MMRKTRNRTTLKAALFAAIVKRGPGIKVFGVYFAKIKSNMKKTIVTILSSLSCLLVFAGGYSTEDAMTTVPQLVRFADIVGVGTATNCTEQGMTIHVSSYWLGNPGSNTLYLSTASYGTPMPMLSNGVSVVFFATTNLHVYLNDVGWNENWDFNVGVSVFDWNYPFSRTKSPPAIPLSLVGNERSVFQVNEEEGNLMLFASNLVQCMRLQPNVTNYYNLVKITSFSGKDKRLKADKIWSLYNSLSYDSLPMIELMAADTNLPPILLNWAKARRNTLLKDK